jgi:predicted amidohydrolase YtcJ
VTRASLVLTLVAFRDAGSVPGDRVEHGAVVPPELHDDLRALGLTIVTQPNFVAERGDDYLAEVDAEDVPHLWPCRSLIDAGIPVAAGTDAPFGRADPWRLVDAAVSRRAPSGAVVGGPERLDPRTALDLLLRPGDRPAALPRRVTEGAPADLCVLSTSLARALASPVESRVAAVVIDGRLHDLRA